MFVKYTSTTALYKLCLKQVLHCHPVDDFDQTGQWTLTIKDIKTGQIYTDIFDGIMAATGHHMAPHFPTFPGQCKFTRRIIHTRHYRNFLEFAGKRVLVIGLGNSGGDIANELSRISSKVSISITKSGVIVLANTRQRKSNGKSRMDNP